MIIHYTVVNKAPNLSELKFNLQIDNEICINWFYENNMEANPSKCQFMILSFQPIKKMMIDISEKVSITSEPFVKTLGVYIDSRLTFNEHIKQTSLKAARQLNAPSRVSKFQSQETDIQKFCYE